ncbi:acyl-CoA dehydrogenase [Microbacterium sp. CFBP9034]|uniref:acyl-CoA dehydrogenase n=1 Tax=Microbacterium sp. CFBP9034 TaxID=3096540 RepID=UPI002A6B7DB0|nr:acyl-CoA dehydrogenase [Microbacterium sp. CFBP9034]MDY0908781.1 acyl-CoA dehydrogenase [Microbacterium sp. CFBP9034]
MPASPITGRPSLAPDAAGESPSTRVEPPSAPLGDPGDDLPSVLAWCVDTGRTAPRVGEGATAVLWELLAATAHQSVAAARVLEPHLDALGILAQAGTDVSVGRDPWDLRSLGVDSRSSWGVFAAEGPGMRVQAREGASGWLLDGTKPWCSLAAHLTHALVTAFVGDERRLFAVALAGQGVSAHDGPWVARGLPTIVSAPVEFAGAAAVPVGDVGWYLRRPGFAWGAMSVAACWWGGALGLRDALAEAAASERADEVALVHLGRADAALWAARAVLREAADLVDRRGTVDMRLLAERVRSTVVDVATEVLAQADAALGPRPLVADERHARRVADLHLYLRQHHGLRDAARLGRLVLSDGTP